MTFESVNGCQMHMLCVKIEVQSVVSHLIINPTAHGYVYAGALASYILNFSKYCDDCVICTINEIR